MTGLPVPQRPSSATHGGVAVVGLMTFVVGIAILRIEHPFGDDLVRSALFLIAVTAGALVLVDLGWQRVHLRPSTGINFRHTDPSWRRTLVKYVGLLGSLGFVGALYWLFPEYHGSYYDRYYAMLWFIVPPVLVLGFPYIHVVDRHMPAPHDGLWHLGALLTLHGGTQHGGTPQRGSVDIRALGHHLLGWLIKGFFLPLMFIALCDGLSKVMAFDFRQLTSFKAWFDFLYDSFYFIDVGLVSMGYLMTLRLTDTHIRSPQSTMLGWAAALVCYEPFWSLIGRGYLAYDTGFTWGAWLWNTPVLYGIWGTMILALVAVYAWATISFGARFSNLTHRGIITNGPYRWTKHPAYLAKNLSWWLISIPFMAGGSLTETIRHCLLLLALNAVYLLRAKTEEWHLSSDPNYLAYSQWIEDQGVFRFAKNLPLARLAVFCQPRGTTHSFDESQEHSLTKP